MKNNHYLLFIFILFFSLNINAQTTIVDAHGQLKIEGNRVLDQCDRPTQLRGMSFFWHQWSDSYKYFNPEVVEWLRDDWKVQIVRGSVAVDNGGWRTNQALADTNINNLIEACIDKGMYITVDWHSHYQHTNDAVEFFTRIAKDYGDHPNVIYEIYNEPTGNSWTDYETWAEMKGYCKTLIAAIRKHDPDNIIIVPTPFYDQFLDEAVDDPLTIDSDGNPVTNIAYSVHAYVGNSSHTATLRNRVTYALNKGYAVWMTECGRTSTDFGSLNNPIDAAAWDVWMEFADENMISWTSWSIGNKPETSSSLFPSASINPLQNPWDYSSDLRSEGKYKRDYFRSANKILPCGPLVLSPDKLSFLYARDTQIVTVLTDLNIVISSSEDWLEIVPSEDSSYMEISVYENPTPEIRYDTIVVSAVVSEGETPTDTLYIEQAPVVHVEEIKLSKSYVTLAIGEFKQLEAYLSPKDSSNDSLSWESLDSEIVTISDGMITGLQVGVTEIVVHTLDSDLTDTCEVTVISCSDDWNITFGKPASASSEESSDLNAMLATDGDRDTRWSSAYNQPESIIVDLEDSYFISRIVLYWEASYATEYKVDVSEDNTNWETIFYTDEGDGGSDILYDLEGVGRYIRIQGFERALPYGFSLWEIKAYGCRTDLMDYLICNTNYLELNYSDTIFSVSVLSNSDFSVSPDSSWIEVESSMYNGNATIQVHVSKNPTTEKRTGTILLSSDTKQHEITIDQAGAPVSSNYQSVNQSLNLYPLPASGQFFIEYSLKQMSEVLIELYDQSGRLLSRLSEDFKTVGFHTETYTIESLKPGVYHILFHLLSEEQSQMHSRKLLVK